MSITKTFTRNMGRLAIDPDQAGLIAGYDMVPNGVTLPDLSGNGNDGVISGAAFEFTEIGPSMKLVGASELLTTTYTDAPASFTVSGWYNLRSSGQGTFGRLFSKGTDILELFVNNSVTDLNLRYENGAGVQNAVISGGYTQDLFCHIAIKYTSGSIEVYLNADLVDTITDSIVLDASALIIGNLSVNALDGNISNFKFYEQALTLAEIQAEYQAGAKAINWKSDYGVDVSIAPESAPGELSNSVARIESGTHEMMTDPIHGKTCKVIECITDGMVQIPTECFHGNDTQAAHGSYELLINKAASSEMVIGFVSNIVAEDTSIIGYQLVLAADESIELRRVTGTGFVSLMKTAAAFFTTGAWHLAKITRRLLAYGLDVIIDGDMEAVGVAAWTPNDSVLTKDTTAPLYEGNQHLRITSTANTFWATQTSFVLGETYRIIGAARTVSGSAIPKIIGLGAVVLWEGIVSTDWQEFDFVTTDLGLIIYIGSTSAHPGAVDFDGIKVLKTNSIFTVYFDKKLLDVSGGSGTNPVIGNTVETSKHWVMGLDAGDKVAWAAPNGECAITKYQGVV